MTTTPVVVQPSKVSLILLIIQAALNGLTIVPGVGPIAGVTEAFVNILSAGLTAYQQETGQPLSLEKIPLETPVP